MNEDGAPSWQQTENHADIPSKGRLTEVHRVDRAVQGGRVFGPAPWVMIGQGRVWAWEQNVGLVRVTDAEPSEQLSFGWDALTPDGRYLCDQVFRLEDDGRGIHDLETGQRRSGRIWDGDNSFVGTFPRVSEGQQLDVYRRNLQGHPPNYVNGRYVVRHGNESVELPLDDACGLPLEGPPAQFSPDGRDIAIGHANLGISYSTSIVEIDSGRVTRFEGMGVSTCGTWSRTGTRLLLRRVRDHLPCVVDRVTGTVLSLKDLVFADSAWHHSEPLVSGWLDDSRVLMSGRFGRRIIMATLDVDTGERVDLLDLPKPAGSEYYGIRYAPALANTKPLLGRPDRMECDMSMQLVDDEHIRVMIWAGLRPHPDGPLTWHVDRPSGIDQLTEDNAAQVGAMLHEQNITAYEERYNDEDYDDGDEFEVLNRPYVHAAPRHTQWTPIDIHKAVEFYVYQSFHNEEHDEAPPVDALMFCGALVRRLGPDVPGWGDPSFPANLTTTAEWEASPWGITSDMRPA